jgi:hypothetical protein
MLKAKKMIVAILMALIFGFLPLATKAYIQVGGGVSGKSGSFSFNLGSGGGGGGGWDMGSISGFGLPSGSIYGIVSNILMWLLLMFGFLGIIGFVLAGIFYILAAGNEKDAAKGKEAMKYSIYGILVGLIGVVIIQAVDMMLRGTGTF